MLHTTVLNVFASGRLILIFNAYQTYDFKIHHNLTIYVELLKYLFSRFFSEIRTYKVSERLFYIMHSDKQLDPRPGGRSFKHSPFP